MQKCKYGRHRYNGAGKAATDSSAEPPDNDLIDFGAF